MGADDRTRRRLPENREKLRVIFEESALCNSLVLPQVCLVAALGTRDLRQAIAPLIFRGGARFLVLAAAQQVL